VTVTDQNRPIEDVTTFLRGGGEMAERIAAYDWSTSLGPVSGWSGSLRTVVGLLIHSPVPMVLLWGGTAS